MSKKLENATTLYILDVARKQASKHENFIKLLRTIRVTRKLRRLHRAFLIWVLTYKYGKRAQISVLDTTFTFYDPRYWYLLNTLYGLGYEPAVTYHMKSLLSNKKMCFFDIGAHFGYFTSYVGSLNKNCKIYSFEPNKKYFKVLQENVRINNIKANLYNIALSNETKVIPFAGPSMKVENLGQSETVNSITFDELKKKENFQPDVVKIDVHGGEGKVLYGMKNALKHDIRHLYCELHPDNFSIEYSTRDVLDILMKSGFELYEINNFRREKTPKFSKLTNKLYNDIINNNKILEQSRRMIYATK
jgi:FkbM family methyltransferase